jgi:hypothetical protein
VPKPDQHQGTMTVEPSRLRLLRDRLASDFYRSGQPAERIAAAVLAALKDHEKTSLPH